MRVDPANPTWCMRSHGCIDPNGHDGKCDMRGQIDPPPNCQCEECQPNLEESMSKRSSYREQIQQIADAHAYRVIGRKFTGRGYEDMLDELATYATHVEDAAIAKTATEIAYSSPAASPSITELLVQINTAQQAMIERVTERMLGMIENFRDGNKGEPTSEAQPDEMWMRDATERMLRVAERIGARPPSVIVRQMSVAIWDQTYECKPGMHVAVQRVPGTDSIERCAWCGEDISK